MVGKKCYKKTIILSECLNDCIVVSSVSHQCTLSLIKTLFPRKMSDCVSCVENC